MNIIHCDTKKIKSFFFKLTFFIIIFLPACTQPKIDPVTGKEEVFEPNLDERAKKYARDNPLFIIGGEKKKQNDFESMFCHISW